MQLSLPDEPIDISLIPFKQVFNKSMKNGTSAHAQYFKYLKDVNDNKYLKT